MVSTEDAGSLVENLSEEPTAITAIYLSEDNTEIENCTLLTMGTLFKTTGKVFQAIKLGNLKQPVKLHLQPIPLEKF